MKVPNLGPDNSSDDRGKGRVRERNEKKGTGLSQSPITMRKGGGRTGGEKESWEVEGEIVRVQRKDPRWTEGPIELIKRGRETAEEMGGGGSLQTVKNFIKERRRETHDPVEVPRQKNGSEREKAEID